MLKNLNFKEKQCLHICVLKSQGKGNALDVWLLNVTEKRDIIHIAHSSGNQKESEKVLSSAWAYWGKLCMLEVARRTKTLKFSREMRGLRI